MTDLNILGISGSLRDGSLNTALLRAAQKFAPAGMAITEYEGMAELPYYNGDLDTEEKLPEQVRELRELIHAADGLLIATPEYNYSIPGGLKNLIDWASRPSATSSLLHKPVATMGAAPTEIRDCPGSARAPAGLRLVRIPMSW